MKPFRIILIKTAALFDGCKSLKAIHSAIEEIDKVEIEKDAFSGINFDECTLFVPPGTELHTGTILYSVSLRTLK